METFFQGYWYSQKGLIEAIRPISLSTCIREVVNTIQQKTNHILPTHFYGFRSGCGAINGVADLTIEIQKAFLEKEYVIAAFLDIESAYSNVHFPTLAN